MYDVDRKDFNAMLHDSKDMPKLQIITHQILQNLLLRGFCYNCCLSQLSASG